MDVVKQVTKHRTAPPPTTRNYPALMSVGLL